MNMMCKCRFRNLPKNSCFETEIEMVNCLVGVANAWSEDREFIIYFFVCQKNVLF